MSIPVHEFDAATSALAGDGWCMMHDLLTVAQTDALARECRAMHDADRLTPAGTGADRTMTRLRGDYTQWFLPEALSTAQRAFADRMDVLRVKLSRELLLGLVDNESHYAFYPVGAGYARHLDRLRDNDARVVSAVFYLNADWLDGDGGALRLHLADASFRDIYPRAGTLVLFLSAQFEHEVLPATRPRMSIACWMRQRALAER
jgi:SM-20-related protein